MQTLAKWIGLIARQPKWRLVVAAVILVAAGFFLFSGPGKSSTRAALFAARRGPLEITVLEGGSLQALESQEIKCERARRSSKLSKKATRSWRMT
jgi:hypothetical protein